MTPSKCWGYSYFCNFWHIIAGCIVILTACFLKNWWTYVHVHRFRFYFDLMSLFCRFSFAFLYRLETGPEHFFWEAIFGVFFWFLDDLGRFWGWFGDDLEMVLICFVGFACRCLLLPVAACCCQLLFKRLCLRSPNGLGGGREVLTMRGGLSPPRAGASNYTLIDYSVFWERQRSRVGIAQPGGQYRSFHVFI